MSETGDGMFQRISTIMERLHFRFIRPSAERFEPTESDLAMFEKALGRKLPADYRTFLGQFGVTGFDNHITFATPGAKGGDEEWLWVFYGYAPGDIYHIQQEWESS